MQTHVAFLRAVNVGGTGKLPMEILRATCIDAGFVIPRTYIASGNVVFGSDRPEHEIKAELEAQLEQYAGKPISVIVRSAAEVADIIRRNPFQDQPGNRVVVLFSDARLPDDPLKGASGVAREQVRLGLREFFISYPDGQADTRLRLPAMTSGTARNMNTIGKVHTMLNGVG
jgi:uncharacterized protein (DUF1697 family)